MAEFADQVALRVKAGDGGHGCASVHREKFKPLGGPDGGNGGRGGDVILEVDASSATLLDFHRRPVRRAGNGRQGEGSNRTGADGTDLIIPVPNGTVVKTADGEVLADLVGVGTRFVAAFQDHKRPPDRLAGFGFDYAAFDSGWLRSLVRPNLKGSQRETQNAKN